MVASCSWSIQDPPRLTTDREPIAGQSNGVQLNRESTSDNDPWPSLAVRKRWSNWKEERISLFPPRLSRSNHDPLYSRFHNPESRSLESFRDPGINSRRVYTRGEFGFFSPRPIGPVTSAGENLIITWRMLIVRSNWNWSKFEIARESNWFPSGRPNYQNEETLVGCVDARGELRKWKCTMNNLWSAITTRTNFPAIRDHTCTRIVLAICWSRNRMVSGGVISSGFWTNFFSI